MSEEIIRTPTYASGGITPEEKVQLEAHAQMWIKRALRTKPTDPAKIIAAVHGLYKAADLKQPRVAITPSPLSMAFAFGAAAAINYERKEGKALDLRRHAANTDPITRAVMHCLGEDYVGGTASAHDIVYDQDDVEVATGTVGVEEPSAHPLAEGEVRPEFELGGYLSFMLEEGGDVVQAMAKVCRDLAGDFGIDCAKRWSYAYQGGAYWCSHDAYLTAARDIIGLQLPEHENYAYWEQAAIHGTFRCLHEDFCIVADFPRAIHIDEENRPHSETGPSHAWRDGWELYYWHGVKVPQHWIEEPDNVDAAEVLAEENVERRVAGCEIIGWARIANDLDRKIIDGDPNTDIGALVEFTIPGLEEPGRFLMATCPRNGLICEGVFRVSDIDGLPIETAIAAQAWGASLPQSEYVHPVIRT